MRHVCAFPCLSPPLTCDENWHFLQVSALVTQKPALSLQRKSSNCHLYVPTNQWVSFQTFSFKLLQSPFFGYVGHCGFSSQPITSLPVTSYIEGYTGLLISAGYRNDTRSRPLRPILLTISNFCIVFLWSLAQLQCGCVYSKKVIFFF